MVRAFLDLLARNPVLLLFVVAAVGYPLGQLRVLGVRLGVSAILFAGLAASAIDARLRLPEFVYIFGLVVFVYTIGVASGPSFFTSLKRRGLRLNLLVVGGLVLAALCVAVAGGLVGADARVTAGLFTGSLTNTPALAGVLELIKASVPEGAARDHALAEPVMAYTIAYPMGVVAMILALAVFARLFRVDRRAEAARLRELGVGELPPEIQPVRVTNPEASARPLRILLRERAWHVVFGRVKRGDALFLPDGDTHLVLNDTVILVGGRADLDEAIAFLGERTEDRLDLDLKTFDSRRMFVSSRAVAGKRIADLHLPQQFGALITRIRRGDVDMVADSRSTLELGDRVRVVAPRERVADVARLLGDSYRSLSEIDVMTFSVGIALGLLLGAVPVPLPGGTRFHLGFAGGPLLVGLVLGRLGRLGRVSWQLPYSASLTLRQIGLILFLAGIGTRSGDAFAATFRQGGGGALLLAGAGVTALVAVAVLVVGYRVLKIPYALLSGVLGGLQTQPAVLAFAAEQAGDESPHVGYATVYPLAMIGKIVLAQILLTWLD